MHHLKIDISVAVAARSHYIEDCFSFSILNPELWHQAEGILVHKAHHCSRWRLHFNGVGLAKLKARESAPERPFKVDHLHVYTKA